MLWYHLTAREGRPSWGPRVIAGVDVGGEAFFKPVELIRSDERHFAGEAGAVAELAQIVGERGNRGRELRSVVIRADLGDELASHERKPCGGAQRRVAVRSVEAHAPCGERIKVRGLHDRVAVGAGELRRELVRHDHHDVRSLGHVQDATAILNARSMTLSSGFQSPSCARMCSTHSSIGRAVSTRISGDVGAS